MTWKQQGNHNICSFQANFKPQSRQVMETTWPPHETTIISNHGNDVEMTLFSSNHLSSNFKLHSKQLMETMWFPCGHNLVSMWFSHGNHMVAMWFAYGHHVVSTWTQHGYNVDTMWFPGIICTLYR